MRPRTTDQSTKRGRKEFATLDKKERFLMFENRYVKKGHLALLWYELDFIHANIDYDYNAKDVSINGDACKRIKGHSQYVISVTGRVYRTVPCNHLELLNYALHTDLKHCTEKKILFQKKRKNDYPRVSLTGDKGSSKNTGKRLLNYLSLVEVMAITFGIVKPNFDKRACKVIHRDGNIHNNHLTNITTTDSTGTNCKVTRSQVKEIKRLIALGYNLNHIGLLYDISEMQVGRIKTGENWSGSGRTIPAPKAAFPVEDGKIRRFIAIFDAVPANKNIKKQFSIKRNPANPIDNVITGILNGYKLRLKHKNITRAKLHVEHLNDYFFKPIGNGANRAI